MPDTEKPEVVDADLVPAEDAAPALPGEAEADEQLIDKAVAELNRIYIGKGLETARALGGYVLEHFFEGDEEAFHERGRKHASFTALAKRDDLRVGYSFLWHSVAIVRQLQLLPDDIAGALPVSHHRLLLPVKDEKAKVRLAKKAAKKGLSKRAFEEEVKKVRRKELGGEKRGRPADPAFVKAMKRVHKAAQLALMEEVSKEAVVCYRPWKAQELVEALEQDIETLQGLAEAVRDRIGEYEAEKVAMEEGEGEGEGE